MEMPLDGFENQPVENSTKIIANSGNYPGIRIATLPHNSSVVALDTISISWVQSNPNDASKFSAVGYTFAKQLQEIIKTKE